MSANQPLKDRLLAILKESIANIEVLLPEAGIRDNLAIAKESVNIIKILDNFEKDGQGLAEAEIDEPQEIKEILVDLEKNFQ